MLRDLGYTALLLGILIFVHELGHFLFAKLLNVKVVRFSLGFGPKLLGFTRGETEYQLAAIPLGGYVKMAGENPYDDSPAEPGRGFLEAAPWKRALIVGAGPAFSLLFPVLVYFFVFLGAQQAHAPKVGYAIEGFPAAEAGLRPGDTIVSIDGTPITTFADISGVLRDKYDREVRVEVERNGERFVANLRPARDVMPDIAGTTQRGMIGISPEPLPPVLGVPADSPAHAAGLRTFDRVLRVNGQPVSTEAELFSRLSEAPGGAETPLELVVLRSEPIAFPAGQLLVPSVVTVQVPKQETGEGYARIGAESSRSYVGTVLPGSAAAKAGLARGDRLLNMDGKPVTSWNVFAHRLRLKGDQSFTLAWQTPEGQRVEKTVAQARMGLRDETGNKTENLELGAQPWVTNFEQGKAERMTLHRGPAEAMSASLKIVPEFIGKTVLSLAAMFTGHMPLDNMGSVLMIHDLAARTAQSGADAYLQLMALISINLGIINLLPIPILDGFGLLAAFWEGVRRRPIPMRVREIANMVGLAMLLLLMGIAIKNDIVRMW